MTTTTIHLTVGTNEIEVVATGSVHPEYAYGESVNDLTEYDVDVESLAWEHNGAPVSKRFQNFITGAQWRDIEHALMYAYADA